MSALELLVAWGAVEVDGQAVFKYCGAVRQWLLHGVFLWVIVWVFFFFGRLYQQLVQVHLH